MQHSSANLTPRQSPPTAVGDALPAEAPSAWATQAGVTESVSSCPTPAPKVFAHGVSLPTLAPGQQIDDYEIIRLLGAGAFAQVYLARQVSLERMVALKVSANQGSEARTLARLEHQHIVQVFSEVVDPYHNLRLLCMQFVPGVTLARLISGLNERPPETWNGRLFLQILDEVCDQPAAFDLGGMATRAYLDGCAYPELVCWLGARLAEALAHAHNQGVVHRDIKPANILVNRYGRPLLADFNIALSTAPGCGSSFGGTLAYMAPEHLDAFRQAAFASADAVDGRSDLYSLNVVLYELLTGEWPFKEKIDSADRAGSLLRLSTERHASAPSPRAVRSKTPELLDRLVRRCLQPEPGRRFQSAGEFMHALDGCRELLHVEKQTMRAGRIFRWCQQRPFLMLLILAVLPHVFGSALNIPYNKLHIVGKDPAQQAYFYDLVIRYNLVVYPVLVFLAWLLASRVYKGWVRLRQEVDMPAADAARLRQQAVALPLWTVLLSALGWFPGGLFFPVALHFGAGPMTLGDFWHFLTSFLLSGLVALTYSYLGVQYVVLRVLYPRLWSDPAAAQRLARQELRRVPDRLRLFHFLAVLIPIAGAALLISVGPDRLSLTFRVLVTALMLLGVAGFAVATVVCNQLTRFLMLLTGRSEGESGSAGRVS